MVKYQYCRKWIHTVWKQYEKERDEYENIRDWEEVFW